MLFSVLVGFEVLGLVWLQTGGGFLKIARPRSQVVRQESAKLLYGSSILPVALKILQKAEYVKKLTSPGGGMVYAEDLKSLTQKGFVGSTPTPGTT